MGKSKSSFARQIADLEISAVKDFDPEGDDNVQSSEDDSGSEESSDELAGTEHYTEVGKSKLRKQAEIALGPKYAGSRVSREALLDDEDDLDDEGEDESESEEETGTFAELDDVDFGVTQEDDDGEIESDAAFADSDEEKFKDFTFRGSRKPREANGSNKRPTAADFMSESESELADAEDLPEDDTDEDILDVDMQHDNGLPIEEDASSDGEGVAGDDKSGAEFEESQASDSEDEDEDEDEDEESSQDEDEEKARRAELRKIMSEDQHTVVATISQAAKADAAKGTAVRKQRKAFDSLLSVRMVLQKALIATNSMAAIEENYVEGSSNQPYDAAEEAAVKLWNSLDGLRHELAKASGSKSGQKRKREIDISTVSTSIWERMQGLEVSMIDLRQTTLDKWSAKVRSTSALPQSRKLNPTAPQLSISSILQDQLASYDHLIPKTKIPRSCAPVQRDAKLTEDPNIYDDGNFYQLLLKELVDQRRVESLSGSIVAGDAGKAMQWTAVKEAKTRKKVDTKASKGRKIRYTVHEKLQNFMAPEERGSWEEDAVDRLFGTLLGQKMTLGEQDTIDEEEAEGVPLEEEGLRLFRS